MPRFATARLITETSPASAAGRRWALLRWPLLAAWVLLVLGLTLTPQQVGPDSAEAALGPWGARGVADSIVNVLMFMPLGVLLYGAVRRHAAALCGCALSAGIELLQLAVPGRFPSLWDVAFNTTGAALGFALARAAPRLVAPPPAARPLLAAGALAVAFTVLTGGTALFPPAAVTTPLFASWTPRTQNGRQFPGYVTAARLGRVPLAPGPLPLAESPARSLLAGDTLDLSFITNARPADAVPIIRLSFGADQSALAVGTSGTDVVFSYRSRAATLHLDQPDLRLPAVLSRARPGQEVHVQVWAPGRWLLCLRADADTHCHPASIGDTWALLLYPVPRPLAGLLPFLWIGLLLLPAGFWLDRPRSALAVAALAGLLVLSARCTGLAPGPLAHLLAVPAGILAGHLAGARSRQPLARRM